MLQTAAVNGNRGPWPWGRCWDRFIAEEYGVIVGLIRHDARTVTVYLIIAIKVHDGNHGAESRQDTSCLSQRRSRPVEVGFCRGSTLASRCRGRYGDNRHDLVLIPKLSKQYFKF